ncbi:DJ-1/PfpI family protein [Aeoliella mucimassa]|uniref:Cysteine protease YraA n=1 Tax=Aeoliella mucimassa TaxID=2527972 RepID=A0A518AR19_9BACT|nr:DJ-1/PfpI family protein [Aeoliella mucimassa]QDU57164.1 Putative cysteine protease YraA [Aeoliella mucimassa]
MSKILMLVGDFVEDYEAMVPLQILQMVGHTVDIVCPDKVAGDSVATAIHDFEGQQTYSEKRGHNFPVTAAFAEAKADDYDALVLPGGRSPEYLAIDSRVIELVQQFAAADKPIAATCHAPLILAAAKVVEGKRCQAYPTVRPELEAAGATWDTPSAGLDSAITDGKLVTAPAWPANANWMRAFLEVLGTKIS